MSLLKQLIECFNEIKSSGIVRGQIDRTSVQEFVDLLNRSIPSQLNTALYSIYRFNRSKYLADKARFITDIKEFSPYDAMILWTDFGDILAFFGLTGKIFLGWDKNKNRYRAYIISNNGPRGVPIAPSPSPSMLPSVLPSAILEPQPFTNTTTEPIQPIDDTPTPNNTPVGSTGTQIHDQLQMIEAMEDDNERAFEYMIQRIAAFKSANNS